jgi:hypothetical protein
LVRFVRVSFKRFLLSCKFSAAWSAATFFSKMSWQMNQAREPVSDFTSPQQILKILSPFSQAVITCERNLIPFSINHIQAELWLGLPTTWLAAKQQQVAMFQPENANNCPKMPNNGIFCCFSTLLCLLGNVILSVIIVLRVPVLRSSSRQDTPPSFDRVRGYVI